MKLLSFSASVEIFVGLILAASPALVVRFLLGADLFEAGKAVGHVAGFGLFALGLACWPRRDDPNEAAVRGLIAYNALATLFFLWLGIRGELVGLLLWPAAALHGILSILLLRTFVVSKTT